MLQRRELTYSLKSENSPYGICEAVEPNPVIFVTKFKQGLGLLRLN